MCKHGAGGKSAFGLRFLVLDCVAAVKGGARMCETVISIQDVSYAYALANGEETHALRGVSLDIARGSFIAIIGHNGSGKSTLAKMLNGLLTPDAGKVTIMGMNTSDEALTWRIRQCAGLVFQNPDNQLVTTIVEEDVAFGPENLGVPPQEIRERVDHALASVGMQAFAKSAPHMLSGGQKQRVAIAGVLAMEPQILVLDESTAMLDPKGRAEVLQAVQNLRRERQMTVVWITHFMDEAAIADRVVVMDAGRIVMDDTPRVIFSRVSELEDIALDVPMASKIAQLLQEAGVDLGCMPVGMQDLAEAVCRYRSNT